MKQTVKCENKTVQSLRKALLVIGLMSFTTMSGASAATVAYGFDQISNLYTNSSLSAELNPGSYFAFGSFYPTFDPTTITKANLLATLKDPTKWFKAFETATLTGEDQTYDVLGTAATANNMYAYAVFINNTLAYVQNAASGTELTTDYGVFTYTNTNPSLRYDLPRDPADYGGDNTSFSNEMGVSAGFNNFVAVGNLGVVTSSAVALIPEPSSAKLLLVAALLFLPWMRRTAKECKI